MPSMQSKLLTETDAKHQHRNHIRSYSVVGSSSDDLNSIFEIKALLEGYATRLAMKYLTAEQYQKLHNINEELRKANENDDAKMRGELNTLFHNTIYEACNSRELYGMIETYWQKYRITKMVLTALPDRSVESAVEHEQILSCMEAGDYDNAEMAMRNHTLRSSEEILKVLKKES